MSHLLFAAFLVVAIVRTARWCLVVVLICLLVILNISSRARWSSVCVLWKKCLFSSSAYFSIRFLFFVRCWVVRVLYVLDINPLSDIWFANIFFLDSIICSPRAFFDDVRFKLFFLLLLALMVFYLKSHYPTQGEKNLHQCFLLRVLVSATTFRSMVNLHLTFTYGVRGPILFFCMYISNYLLSMCWKGYSFSILMAW